MFRCSSNVNGTKALLDLGAKNVCAFDLDKSIFKTAPKFLKKFEGRYELKTGNVLDIPYNDNFFDFVFCSGVLHHTTDLFKGLSELSRVTKHGGTLYFSTLGTGGIFSKITKSLRKEYSEDASFQSLINNLTENKITDAIKWTYTELEKHNESVINKIPLDAITSLIDNDLILTIKDRITAPLYKETPFAEITNWLEKNGFVEIERLTRYPKFSNIRKFLSPAYHDYKSDLSKVLFNEGFLQIKALKK